MVARFLSLRFNINLQMALYIYHVRTIPTSVEGGRQRVKYIGIRPNSCVKHSSNNVNGKLKVWLLTRQNLTLVPYPLGGFSHHATRRTRVPCTQDACHKGHDACHKGHDPLTSVTPSLKEGIS